MGGKKFSTEKPNDHNTRKTQCQNAGSSGLGKFEESTFRSPNAGSSGLGKFEESRFRSLERG